MNSFACHNAHGSRLSCSPQSSDMEVEGSVADRCNTAPLDGARKLSAPVVAEKKRESSRRFGADVPGRGRHGILLAEQQKKERGKEKAEGEACEDREKREINRERYRESRREM